MGMAMIAHKILTIRLIKLWKYSCRINPFSPITDGGHNPDLPVGAFLGLTHRNVKVTYALSPQAKGQQQNTPLVRGH
jgi:hypothetical protein